MAEPFDEIDEVTFEPIMLEHVRFIQDDPCTVYFTRDARVDGTLTATIDMWAARPHSSRAGKGVIWYPADIALDSLMGRYTVAAVQAYLGTVPDEPMQCIRKVRFAYDDGLN